MSNFIENNLMPGEKILYRGQVASFIYLEAILWVLVAGAVIFFGSQALHLPTNVVKVLTAVMLIIIIRKAGTAFIHQTCTELAVTDSRVIAKYGFIRRDVIELPLERIESVVIDQTIMERIMNAGSVGVRGTGITMAPVRFIDKPIELRNKINEAIAHRKAN